MAMGPDRVELLTDISYFVNVTGTRGRAMVYDTSTTGLGAAMDSSNAVVKLPLVANGSGELLAGILANDVVNKDLSQTHLNRHKDEVQVGSKVRLIKRGWITTNIINYDCTPSPGTAAYFTASVSWPALPLTRRELVLGAVAKTRMAMLSFILTLFKDFC